MFGSIVAMRGVGRRIAISTSKIRNTIVIIKNRNENGIREEEKGSNPHSNGDSFSRSDELFFLIMDAVKITRVAMIITAKMRMLSAAIISFKI